MKGALTWDPIFGKVRANAAMSVNAERPVGTLRRPTITITPSRKAPSPRSYRLTPRKKRLPHIY